MDIDLMVLVSIIFYIFFITLRYWKGMLIYNIVAIVPLIILISYFSKESYEVVVLFTGLIVVHIADFFISLNN